MAAPTFKDHFSRQSADYVRYRPGYPPALIEHAQPHPRVRYQQAMAEHLPVPDASVSLVAAALPFPWPDEPVPRFELQTDWTLEQALGYLALWSSVQRYKDAHPGQDPLPAIAAELATLWPAGGTLRLNWPIHLRLGRN